MILQRDIPVSVYEAVGLAAAIVVVFFALLFLLAFVNALIVRLNRYLDKRRFLRAARRAFDAHNIRGEIVGCEVRDVEPGKGAVVTITRAPEDS